MHITGIKFIPQQYRQELCFQNFMVILNKNDKKWEIRTDVLFTHPYFFPKSWPAFTCELPVRNIGGIASEHENSKLLVVG